MAYTAAAIDIGSWSIKVALGRVKVRSLQLLDFKELVIGSYKDVKPASEMISKGVMEVISQLPYKPDVVITSLSGGEFFVRYLRFPRVGMKKLQQLAFSEIEDDLPVQDKDYVIDTAIVGETPDGKFVDCIVVSAFKEKIAGTINLLDGLGLDPAEITCAPSFFPHIISSIIKGSEKLSRVALLEIGHSVSELIITDGNSSLFYRSIVWGGKNLTGKIASYFLISPDEAEEMKCNIASLMPSGDYQIGSFEEKLVSVCREAISPLLVDLRQSLMGYFSKTGNYPEKIFVFGGTALLKGLGEYLTSITGIETLIINKWNGISSSGVRALALLEKSVSKNEKTLNFRQGDLIYQGKLTARRRLWIRAIIFIVVIIAGWFFYSIAKISSLKSVLENQSKELAEITERITGEKIQSFERAELLLKKVTPGKSPVPKNDAYDILENMSLLIPEDVVHDVEELDIRPERWRIRGIVDSIGDRDRVCKALEDYKECVSAVNKGNTTLSPKDNKQKYNLDIKSTCP